MASNREISDLELKGTECIDSSEQGASLLKVTSGNKSNETHNENLTKKWQKTVNDAMERNKTSWKLIDGSVDENDWGSDVGCWKWVRRFLIIGNLGVIIVCFSLLLASSIVCFKR